MLYGISLFPLTRTLSSITRLPVKTLHRAAVMIGPAQITLQRSIHQVVPNSVPRFAMFDYKKHPSILVKTDFSSDAAPPSPQEEKLISALAANFPNATDIAVVDVSGGCGAGFEVYVEAPDFTGLRLVKQHQLVTKALKREIEDMHSIRISTAASPCD